MSTQHLLFEAAYPTELIEQAARAFRDYRFRRYGPWLIAACLVNGLGFALLAWVGTWPGVHLDLLPMVGVGVIAAIGPIWLLYEYFVAPQRHAARLRAILPPYVRISLGPDALRVSAKGKEAAIPWPRIRAVVETNALFLLVLSPGAFGFIPRAAMPMEAYEALHAKSGKGAA